MKPTSIIFIIISVLLACVGILLMVTATNMADTQGISLFTQTGDDDSNFTTVFELDDENAKKIILSLTDVDVKVIGHSKESKIEIVNFPEGTYEYTEGKTSVNLSDGTSITNIIDIDNLKINFNGFRDYLHYFKYKDKPRYVNIYLSDDCMTNVLNISTGGDVSIESLELNLDYKIKVKEGNVTVDDVKTDSSIVIDSTDDSNINITACDVNDLEINGINAFATIQRTSFLRSLYVKILSGGVDFDATTDFEGYKVLFEADAGVVDFLSNRIINGKYESDTRVDKPDDTTDSSAIAGSSSVVGKTETNSTKIEGNTATIIVLDGDIKVY